MKKGLQFFFEKVVFSYYVISISKKQLDISLSYVFIILFSTLRHKWWYFAKILANIKHNSLEKSMWISNYNQKDCKILEHLISISRKKRHNERMGYKKRRNKTPHIRFCKYYFLYLPKIVLEHQVFMVNRKPERRIQYTGCIFNTIRLCRLVMRLKFSDVQGAYNNQKSMRSISNYGSWLKCPIRLIFCHYLIFNFFTFRKWYRCPAFKSCGTKSKWTFPKIWTM